MPYNKKKIRYKDLKENIKSFTFFADNTNVYIEHHKEPLNLISEFSKTVAYQVNTEN